MQVPPPDGVILIAGSSSPKAGRRLGPFLIAIVALFLAAAGGAGLFLFTALRGTGDVLDRMIPASSSVYVTAYLDPAAQQKLNLRGLLERFPRLRGEEGLDSSIDELLDRALQGSGLSAKDVRPWLGSQIALVVRVREGRPLVAVLAASKDDARARAALEKFRTGPEAGVDTWKMTSHGGVTISVGSLHGRTEGAFALVGHAAVLANDPAIIEEVIDTSRGRQLNLRASDRFLRTTRQLPAQRLALAYVDFRPLVERIKQDIARSQVPDLGQLSGSISQLEAIQGLGAALSAERTGIATDITMTIDRSKLSAEQRRGFAQGPSHQNAVLSFTPSGAYGVLAMGGFRETVRSAIDQFSRDPAFADVERELGLSAVVEHLTGDAGIEAGPGTSGGFPGVALLLGTDDEKAMRVFLDRLAVKALEDLGEHAKGPGPRWKRETYRGVSISFLPVTKGGPAGLTPAYAVTAGMGILGSSPEEVRAVIDARAEGSNITSSQNFIDAVGARDRSPGMIYVDLERIVSSIRQSMPPEVQARFDAETGKDLAPLRAFILTSTNGPDRSSARLFLLIR
jgi:hypothetical protein